MLKKLFVSFVCLFCLTLEVSAEKIHASFEVSYGVLGKIGTAEAVLEKKNQSYTIDIKLQATGIAKLLSRGREEQHTSHGHLVNSIMISDVYKVTKSYGNVRTVKEYIIDHKKKKIEKIYRKYKKEILLRKEISTLDFYAKNDLLTLYFNLDAIIKDKHKPYTYLFKTVGAERQKGKVSVEIPSEKQLKRYKQALGDDASWYATVIIHQKIFSSKEGRLMLGIAKDGITNTALLKDVILFGDIKALRVK